MAETYHDDLLENYESLREDRDWSRELMAETIEQQDPALAAKYRQRFAEQADDADGAKKAPAKKAPAKRQSKASAEQTEA